MVMAMVLDSGKLVALDLVEENPIPDMANPAVIPATELVHSALGMCIIR